MPVVDIFSKRQKRLTRKTPDGYQYDTLPEAFRVQVIRIIERAFGADSFDSDYSWRFEYVHDTLAEEYGVLGLDRTGDDGYRKIVNFVMTGSAEQVLDVIELSIQVAVRGHLRERDFPPPSEAVAELNTRLQEHGIGYRIQEDRVTRIDSEYLHQEVVKPALAVLREPHFAGAEEELQKAHNHYRCKRYEEAIGESFKALESTLKVICGRRQWPFQERDTANRLIEIVFDKGLIPSYLQSQFAALRSVLESGVPVIRNRSAGHGKGETARQVPPHLAGYVLHLTAAAVVFLAACERQR